MNEHLGARNVVTAWNYGQETVGLPEITSWSHLLFFFLKNFIHIRTMGIPIISSTTVAAILAKSIYHFLLCSRNQRLVTIKKAPANAFHLAVSSASLNPCFPGLFHIR